MYRKREREREGGREGWMEGEHVIANLPYLKCVSGNDIVECT